MDYRSDSDFPSERAHELVEEKYGRDRVLWRFEGEKIIKPMRKSDKLIDLSDQYKCRLFVSESPPVKSCGTEYDKDENVLSSALEQDVIRPFVFFYYDPNKNALDLEEAGFDWVRHSVKWAINSVRLWANMETLTLRGINTGCITKAK